MCAVRAGKGSFPRDRGWVIPVSVATATEVVLREFSEDVGRVWPVSRSSMRLNRSRYRSCMVPTAARFASAYRLEPCPYEAACLRHLSLP
jgi:hypothetical protein